MYLLSGILNTINTAPQTPMEYLQHVLTPEVGFRLIREDLIKNGTLKKKDPDLDQQVRHIMVESTGFGCYLQQLDWDDPMADDDDDDD
jgi:hypothetical protein